MTAFCTLETKCPYLSNEKSRTEYLYIKNCSFSLNSELVKRGYRRFGEYFQRPICGFCDECVSVRIDAFKFKLSKSQRRNLRKNLKTNWMITRPLVDREHVELFKKYHKYMEHKKDWKYYDMDIRKYYDIYVLGYGKFGKEISFYDENKKLICVDLIDIVDDGISSIYCYYDPDFLHLGLGKFSLLKEIEFAKISNLRWIYLGYYVKGCDSLEYKKDFLPQEALREYVDFYQEPVWVDFK
ncbi:arginyltransferase [Campylobacter sp. FMV-PI01]|uniref:Arginyltransferase n=1 Tax=Campylobacter portucalensis TaxID=2608384 RepID=A0A6L5WH08_9BACT|nr:arginyltransferase [Campylobacter portucalensis]MSN96319.1 arginyltransferase [Campylobacter portucalensis]